MRLRNVGFLLSGALLIASSSAPVAAQVQASEVATPPSASAAAPSHCNDCHQKSTDPRRPVPAATLLETSIHASLDCTDCHAGVSMKDLNLAESDPHPPSATPVACADCHEQEAAVYRKHGRMEVGMDPDIPRCWDCHGAHDVLPTADRQSHVHPINLPGTCRTCHTDVDLVERHDILRDKPIKLYESSVHGKASRKGLYVSATCNDCHSAPDPDGKRTAHRILSAADRDSTIYHFNIPDTCGQCHQSVTKDYWEGIHGKFVKRGEVASPVCTHCHGEHGIISPSDPRSPVSAARVAEQTCAPCHESARLNEKYGVPAGRLRSYVDSYHGLKAKAGDVHVANCASCHGAHRILPSVDPSSSIHATNLQRTCGECHPNISAQLANTPIHETAAGLKTGWPRFFTVLYYWIIGITIGLMGLHCIADYVRCIQNMRKKPFVVRMNFNETMQHWLLMISFVVLVVSGFSLRFSEAWWVQLLFGWGGGAGFVFRGLIHRIAAVLFIISCVWHVGYLFTARGRRWLRDMILARRDFVDIGRNSLYFLGRREDGPSFPRFSYMEKCEYWALLWGAIIMSGTGILLWFDNYFTETWLLPKGVLDVMLIIHYYEAWLATLAIFVWHGYSTIFNPRVYPMNPAWLDGRMPKDLYAHEHPEGPRLRTVVQRTLYEEEEEEEKATSGSKAHATPSPAARDGGVDGRRASAGDAAQRPVTPERPGAPKP